MRTQRGQGRIQSFRPPPKPRRSNVELEVKIFRYHNMAEDHREALARWLRQQWGLVAASTENGFYAAFRFADGWERTASVSVRNRGLMAIHDMTDCAEDIRVIAWAVLEKEVGEKCGREVTRRLEQTKRGMIAMRSRAHVYRRVIDKFS